MIPSTSLIVFVTAEQTVVMERIPIEDVAKTAYQMVPSFTKAITVSMALTP